MAHGMTVSISLCQETLTPSALCLHAAAFDPPQNRADDSLVHDAPVRL